jgi:Flp pilus assembly pilin Flp
MSIQTIKSFFQEESGQDLVEYSLLLGFLALGSLALLSSAGASVKTIWTSISTNLTTAAATAGS